MTKMAFQVIRRRIMCLDSCINTCKRQKCGPFLIPHRKMNSRQSKELKCGFFFLKPQNTKQEENIDEFFYAVGLRKQFQGIKSKIETIRERTDVVSGIKINFLYFKTNHK